MIFQLMVIGIWAIFGIYWLVSARDTKKTVYRARPTKRAFVTLIAGVVLIFFYSQDKYAQPLVSVRPEVQLLGVILCAAGVAIAIWARRYLGRNWNALPSLKEGHELVTGGPYRWVRHPIYSGAILAIFGSVVPYVTIPNVLVFVMVTVMFVFKAGTEERLMMQQFPDAYPEYKKTTKALVPFIW